MKRKVKITLIFAIAALALTALIVSPHVINKESKDPENHVVRESCSFGAWSTSIEPTCIAEGEKVRYCSCGYREQEKLSTVDHCPDLWVENEDDISMFCAMCNTLVAKKQASVGLAYRLNSNGKSYSVISSNECHDEEIVIPLTHNGLPVTRVASLSPPWEYDWWAEKRIYEESFVKRVYTSCQIEYFGDLYACDKLEYIYLSENVTNVDFSSWKRNNMMSNIEIDISYLNRQYKSVNGIIYSNREKSLVYYSPKRNDLSFEVPAGVELIEDQAFYGCSALCEVSIPTSVTNIGANAFSGCSSLKTVRIGKGVSDLSISAFWNCPSLESIEVDPENANYTSVDGNLYDKNVTRIIQYASGKTKSEFTLPNGITTVGKMAFSGANHLSAVALPGGVKIIEALAFNDCEALKYIYLPASLELINSHAFGGSTAIERVYAPSLKDWCEIKLEYSNFYASPLCAGGSLYLGGELFDQYCWDNKDYFDMPKGALRGCGSLTHLSVQGKISSIPQEAFYHCDSLETVNIGSSVRAIGRSAFRYCISLTEVNIDPNVYSIDDAAFANCTSLETLLLPQNLTQINKELFGGCTALKRVVIPAEVKKIYDRAFWKCTSLTEIQYLGTVEQWLAIEKAGNFDLDTGDYTVYCTNGTIKKQNAN